jgi:ketosteroid isomerase-like protein
MKRKNIETLLAWLDALRRGDREAVSGTLDADIVWQGVRDDLVCYGPAEVADGFAAALAEGFDVEALELIGAERHAILHARLPDAVEIAGVVFAEGVYNVFAIAGGRITRIDDYARRAEALAAAGLAQS